MYLLFTNSCASWSWMNSTITVMFKSNYEIISRKMLILSLLIQPIKAWNELYNHLKLIFKIFGRVVDPIFSTVSPCFYSLIVITFAKPNGFYFLNAISDLWPVRDMISRSFLFLPEWLVNFLPVPLYCNFLHYLLSPLRSLWSTWLLQSLSISLCFGCSFCLIPGLPNVS